MAFFRFFAGILVVALLVAFSGLLIPQPRASMAETVHIAPGGAIALATPPFVQKGKRYAFTWPGGGPSQTFTIKDVRPDGWVLVEVAEENVDPGYVPLGTIPTRWLNVGIATSIQEMRPLLHGGR
jgi:hypothetical protein